MIFALTEGVLIGAGIFGVVKAGLKLARKLVRRTKTTKDDAVVDAIDDAVNVLKEHPELVDFIRQIGKKL